MRANFLAASFDCAVLFAPVQTIFPLWNIRAVVLGCRMRMMTAENRLGLYSEFLVFTVIFFKSRRVPKKTVLMVFWILKVCSISSPLKLNVCFFNISLDLRYFAVERVVLLLL